MSYGTFILIAGGAGLILGCLLAAIADEGRGYLLASTTAFFLCVGGFLAALLGD